MKPHPAQVLILLSLGMIVLLASGQPAAASPLLQVSSDCEAFRQQGLEFMGHTQYTEAIQAFQEALICYDKKPGHHRGERAAILNNLGAAYDHQGQFEDALANYTQALSLVRETGNQAGEVTILNNIGAVYYRQGRYEEALENYQQALTLARQVRDQAGLGALHNNIGEVYRAQGRYDDALAHYQQAATLYQQKDDRVGQASALNNTGLAYAEQRRYSEALAVYEQALTLRQEVGDRLGQAITLTNIGFAAEAQGSYDEALSRFQQALTIYQELGQPANAGLTQTHLGALYQRQGQYAAALQSYQQALALLNAAGDKVGQAGALHNLAGVSWAQGDYEAALTHYQQALALRREVADQVGEVSTLNSLGAVYSAQGRFQQAEEAYRPALTLARQTGDRAGEGTALNNLGSVYQAQGRYSEALSSFQQALVLMRESGDRVGEGAALNNLGSVYQAQGRYSEAQTNYQEALALRREMNDRVGQVASLNGLGSLYAAQGRYAEAEANYQKNLTLQRQVGDRAGEGTTLRYLGSLYSSQGHYSEALATYEKALAIHQEVGDRAGEGSALDNLGSVYRAQGHYAEALDHYQRALVIQRETGNRAGEGVTLNNIGSVYQDQGRYDKALASFQDALTITQEIGDRAGAGTAFNNLGAVHQARQDYTEALANFQQALDLAEEIGQQASQISILNNLGSVYGAQGDYEKALAYFQQALHLAQTLGDLARQGNILTNLGSIYQAQGQFNKAMTYFQQALTLHRETGQQVATGATLDQMGAVFEALNRPEEALRAYQQAMDILEAVRATAGSEQGRAGFIARYADLYARAAALFHRQGDDEAAFFTSERGRARAFLDSLATGQVELTDEVAADLLTREQETYVQRQALQDALAQARALQPANPALVADLEAQLAQAEAAHTEAVAAINARHDHLATLIPGRSAVLGVAEVQPWLDEQTTLLVYFTLTDHILAFIVTRNTFQGVEIQVTPQQLAERISAFRQVINLKQPKATQPVAQSLYDLLIAPLAPALRTTQLVIVPHGSLHYLPFAALFDRDTGHYLAQTYTMTTLPSASSLPFIREKEAHAEPLTAASSANLPVLVLGNPAPAADLPPLQAAEQEARAVAGLYQTQPLLGAAATESAVRAQAGGVRILHLAAHGEYNLADPLASTLYLTPDAAQDGRLEVREIYGLKLTHTGLVVLSACQTQLGELSAGDELVGLTRAFFAAGAPSIIASLWNVNDTATSQLMERFYLHLQEGQGQAEALRQAQLDLLAKYPEPYYWAAFVLSGAGGERNGRAEEHTPSGAPKGGGSGGAGEQPSPERTDGAESAAWLPGLAEFFLGPGSWLVGGVLLVVAIAGAGLSWRLRRRQPGLAKVVQAGRQPDQPQLPSDWDIDLSRRECLNCHTLNEADGRFCQNCDQPLSD